MTAVIILLALCGLMNAARSFEPIGGSVELAFGFLLLCAFFGGSLVEKIKSPKLTGYLLVGVAAGPFVLRLVSTEMVQNLTLVQDVAVCLIALTAGAELSINKIRPLLGTIKSITLWGVLGTTILIAGSIIALQPLLPFLHELSMVGVAMVSLMLAIVLASQSPAVVMALLDETRSDGPVSQTTLAVVVIADLMVIILFAVASSFVAAVIGSGEGSILSTVFTAIGFEIVLSGVIGLVIGIIFSLYLQYVKGNASLFVLLVCGVVAQVSPIMHLDALIVLLTAGVYLENFSKADCHKLIHDLEAAALPVYLVFFAVVGAKLDLALLATVILPAAIIALVRALGFWRGCAIAAKRSNANKEVAKWTWIGLLPQAGLALALVQILERAYPEPSFGPQASALILGVVGLNQLVTPILLRIALIKSGEAGKREVFDFAADDEDTTHHAAIPQAIPSAEKP